MTYPIFNKLFKSNDLNIHAFNMITGKNESKILTNTAWKKKFPVKDFYIFWAVKRYIMQM